MKDIHLKSQSIGKGHKPFIIAEMSGNHNQSLDRALELIDLAADAGAHAVKFQTYTAETMTIQSDMPGFKIEDENSLWHGESLYELYEKAHTPWEWHDALFSRAREKGLVPLSTPFDETSVDFLETLDPEIYKIASFENTDLRLIKKVAQTGKPIIVSTGMATLAEMQDAVTTMRENGCEDFVLLKCTSSYPSSPENSNVSTIKHMEGLFNCQIGLSDHSMGLGVACSSIAFGATVIEKHFTKSRADGGVDSAFSLEAHELKELVIETERAWQSVGSISYGAKGVENKSKAFRRTLYFVEDLKAGDIITEKNMRAIRPGFGEAVKYYDHFLGKKIKKDISKGTPVSFDLI